MYLGNAIGGRFEPGEYQKIVKIIPYAAENYQVVGRMTAQSGFQTHTINFNAALRSDTLPNLAWSVNYNENYVSSKFKNHWTQLQFYTLINASGQVILTGKITGVDRIYSW